MKSNITLIALNSEFKNKIATQLAERLGMFLVNINDIIKYDLLNIKEVISLAGLEYYNKIESKTVKAISSYENSLITLELDTFFNNDNYKFLKTSSLFIYIRLNFEDYKDLLDLDKSLDKHFEKILNKKNYKERDSIMISLSDIVVNVNIKEDITETTIEEIKKYYNEA